MYILKHLSLNFWHLLRKQTITKSAICVVPLAQLEPCLLYDWTPRSITKPLGQWEQNQLWKVKRYGSKIVELIRESLREHKKAVTLPGRSTGEWVLRGNRTCSKQAKEALGPWLYLDTNGRSQGRGRHEGTQLTAQFKIKLLSFQENEIHHKTTLFLFGLIRLSCVHLFWGSI